MRRKCKHILNRCAFLVESEVIRVTDKQKFFCDEYLIDLNATQAAIRAGYSEKYANTNANKLLQNTTIQEYIKKRLDEKKDTLIAKQDEVLKYLTATMRREQLENVVVTCKTHKSYYDDKGKKVIEDKEEPVAIEIPTKVSDANRAAELLGKYYTLFTDKAQIDSNSSVVIINDIPKGEDNGS